MRFVFIAIVSVVIAAPVNAQTLYGTLVGNVTDPSGASIVGAKVVAANTATGFTPPRRQNSIVSTPQEGLVANVNGTTKSTNNTRIDGASNMHIWLPQHSAYMPPLEAIETVNVVTNSMDAEQGLAGGAAINVTMKSGTNEFHGSGFEYHVNSALKAKNVFFTEAKKPKFIQNQYGGTL